VTFWGVTRRISAVALVLVLAAACSDSDPEAAPSTTSGATTSTAEATTTTTAPEWMPSTTTTAFDPASVEGEVEAAYLRSWDVYAQAVYDLELVEAALAEVFGERSLDTRREEITDRIETGRAAHVVIEHDYQVVIVEPGLALVVDAFTNHQVLIDPVTKEPIEEDPNERLLVNFQMKLVEGSWRVTLIQKVSG
jgi:hypothetical protein